MPKRSSKKLPRDVNQLAKAIVERATGEKPPEPVEERSPESRAAALLGRKGGLKGGKARAVKLSEERKTEIARNAAKKRWAKRSK
jgi:hypothetical protein